MQTGEQMTRDALSLVDAERLDWPQKLSLKLVGKTEDEMRHAYTKYVAVKEKRSESDAVLDFRQFLFFSAIRAVGPAFIFRETKLAYAMMVRTGVPVIERDQWLRYAPAMPPLAAKHDAGLIFDVLTVDLKTGAAGVHTASAAAAAAAAAGGSASGGKGSTMDAGANSNTPLPTSWLNSVVKQATAVALGGGGGAQGLLVARAAAAKGSTPAPGDAANSGLAVAPKIATAAPIASSSAPNSPPPATGASAMGVTTATGGVVGLGWDRLSAYVQGLTKQHTSARDEWKTIWDDFGIDKHASPPESDVKTAAAASAALDAGTGGAAAIAAAAMRSGPLNRSEERIAVIRNQCTLDGLTNLGSLAITNKHLAFQTALTSKRTLINFDEIERLDKSLGGGLFGKNDELQGFKVFTRKNRDAGAGGASGALSVDTKAASTTPVGGTTTPLAGKPISKSAALMAAAAIAKARSVAGVSSGGGSGGLTVSVARPVATPAPAVALPAAVPIASPPSGSSGASVSGGSSSSSVAAAVPIAAATALVERVFQFPGFGDDLPRDRRRTWVYVRDLYMAHVIAKEQAEKNPKLGQRVLDTVFGSIQRMIALEHVKELSTAVGVDICTISSFPTEAARDKLIEALDDELEYVAKIKASHEHWLDSILPGLAHDTSKVVHDVDPEFDARFTSADHKPPPRKEKEFSPSETSQIIKTIGRQIQPVFLLIHHAKKLKQWQNPKWTAFVFLFCLNMAYQDLVCYLPALILLLHSILLLSLRGNPTLFQGWIEGMEQEEAAEAFAKQQHERQVAAITDGPSIGGNAALEQSQNVSTALTESIGILGKIKEYKQQYESTKLGLAGIQGQLSRASQSLRRVEGLYKWWSQATTFRFFCISCTGFIVMCVVPFRFLWALIVIDQFTEKYQPQGSAFQRLLEQVPLIDGPQPQPQAPAAAATAVAAAGGGGGGHHAHRHRKHE